jgi:hypothetical protein
MSVQTIGTIGKPQVWLTWEWECQSHIRFLSEALFSHIFPSSPSSICVIFSPAFKIRSSEVQYNHAPQYLPPPLITASVHHVHEDEVVTTTNTHLL